MWLTRVVYGSPGDLPVTGDWDGNGRTDLGVLAPRHGSVLPAIRPGPGSAGHRLQDARLRHAAG